MIRPTVARVDLAAIEDNLRAIWTFLSTPRPSPLVLPASHLDAPRTSHLAPRIIAVIKANAYGHGASEVGLALERAGAAMLACADIEEGTSCRSPRRARIPILVLRLRWGSAIRRRLRFGLTADDFTRPRPKNLAGRPPPAGRRRSPKRPPAFVI
jgi:alanine racemase